MDELQYYQAFFKSLPEGILLVDENGRFLDANRAFIQEYGPLYDSYRKGELSENPIAAQLVTLFNGVISSNQPSVCVKSIDGKEALISFSPLSDGRNNRGAVALFSPLRPLSKLAARYKKYNLSMEKYLKELYSANYTLNDIIGDSAVMTDIKQTTLQIAPTEISVLITGESGTGKELFASAIHRLSNRKGNAFVTINCPSITDTLLESELFGYEKGAFTGAGESGKLGLCEVADGGTLFLDEVGDLSMANQVKLLRFIESGSFLRVGGVTPVNVNIRIISATNKDLNAMVSAGLFRQDLLFRLARITLELPPLRERLEDIPQLVRHFSSPSLRISPEALRQLKSYPWPGNVRELKNTVSSIMDTLDSDIIRTSDLPESISGASDPEGRPSASSPAARDFDFPRRSLNTKEQWEYQQIRELLAEYGTTVNAKRLIAKKLGISLATLYSRIKYYFPES